jgi:hypothetical protein
MDKPEPQPELPANVRAVLTRIASGPRWGGGLGWPEPPSPHRQGCRRPEVRVLVQGLGLVGQREAKLEAGAAAAGWVGELQVATVGVGQPPGDIQTEP